MPNSKILITKTIRFKSQVGLFGDILILNMSCHYVNKRVLKL